MTVNTTTITSGPYTATGGQTLFDYTFRADVATDLDVYVNEVLRSDYTVLNLGVDTGGQIQFITGLTSGDEVYIRSSREATQDTEFSSQGGFYPEEHERAFDKLTYLIQQLGDKIKRTLRIADTKSELSIVDLIAGRFLQVNATGDGFQMAERPVEQVLSDGVINTVADIPYTGMVDGAVYTLKEYHAGTKTGGGQLKAFAGSITPDNGITFNGPTGYYLMRINIGSEYHADWFGARGVSNGGADDTAAINAAITACNAAGGGRVTLRADTYMIDGNANPTVFIYGGIIMKQYVELDLNGATLQLKTTSNANYAIINGWRTTDFTVKNGILIGDLITHTGVDGEFGHGLFLAESKRVTIDNIISNDCWGDGIYLSEETTEPSPDPLITRRAKDISVYNSSFRRNRRQGCSITGADNIHFYSCEFLDTGTVSGTAPSAGVDIEPLTDGVPCENISFNDCVFSGNAIGVVLDTIFPNNIKDVTFNNCSIVSSTQSGYFSNRDVSGIRNVTMNNCRIDQGVYGGVGTTFNDCVITRDGGSTSTYAIEMTANTKEMFVNGGEVRSIGSSIKPIFVPGSKTFKDRCIFTNVDIVLESGPSGTSIVAFSPVEFNRCRFLKEGTTPGSAFGLDFDDNRLGKNFTYIRDCYFDPEWNSALSYTTGPYTMNETKVYSVAQPGTLTPNCGIGDAVIVTFTTGSSMGVAAPINAYGKTLTITFKNTSGGALGSIVWNAIYKLSAWTSPANGFSRSITFLFDGTNWVEINRTTADVPN